MLEFQACFQDGAGDPQALLDRLVRVGIRADGDRFRDIAAFPECLLKQGGRVGLEEELALEIQPRRIAPIGVARPGIAIDAAVLSCCTLQI